MDTREKWTVGAIITASVVIAGLTFVWQGWIQGKPVEAGVWAWGIILTYYAIALTIVIAFGQPTALHKRVKDSAPVVAAMFAAYGVAWSVFFNSTKTTAPKADCNFILVGQVQVNESDASEVLSTLNERLENETRNETPEQN